MICPGLHDAQNTLRNFSSLTGICRLDTLIAATIGMLAGGGLIYFCSIMGKWVFKKDAMGSWGGKPHGYDWRDHGLEISGIDFFVAPFLGS